MAPVLQLMAETGKSVGQLADEIGRYVMVKPNILPTTAAAQAIIEKPKPFFGRTN